MNNRFDNATKFLIENHGVVWLSSNEAHTWCIYTVHLTPQMRPSTNLGVHYNIVFNVSILGSMPLCVNETSRVFFFFTLFLKKGKTLHY